MERETEKRRKRKGKKVVLKSLKYERPLSNEVKNKNIRVLRETLLKSVPSDECGVK